jgi:hypothetical protein
VTNPQFGLGLPFRSRNHPGMTLIQNATRNLCRLQGESEEDVATSTPRWAAYVLQVRAVLEALHEPSEAMKLAGSEIIRHVDAEENAISHHSDNVWRSMVYVLKQQIRGQEKNYASQ